MSFLITGGGSVRIWKVGVVLSSSDSVSELLASSTKGLFRSCC